MSITAGLKLGPYEVRSRIGAGGMGEVYRARDTRLDRDVAIKILPPHLDADSDARERFDREARAISALNHPNICTLFDVGSDEGRSYLVMELIEGETLAERLTRERLPIDVALRYAIEIAKALDCAHRVGIVHRDLKPGNVMITRAGLKLLDFGLARLAVSARTAHDAPTVIHPVTMEGMIVGTLQYMSPEQLQGKATDTRTDIFAFGCVLYEMLTGRRLYDSSSQAAVISAIMTAEPPLLSGASPYMRPSIERLVRKCLAKSADDRWQSAGDLATELQWIADEIAHPGDPESNVPQQNRRARTALPWVIALLAIGAGALAAIRDWRPTQQGPLLRLVAPIAADRIQIAHGLRGLAISPDGQFLVYPAFQNGKRMLWLRSLRDGTAAPIPNTESGTEPVWSPDSKEIAFVSRAGLMKISPAGADLAKICDGRALATWGSDGTIVFPAPDGLSLMQVAAAGGIPARLRIAPLPPKTTVAWPVFVGSNGDLAYCVIDDAGGIRLHLFSPERERDTDLGPVESRIEVVDDILLFVRDGGLLAQRVGERLTRESEPVRIAGNVSNYSTAGTARFSASATTLAFVGSETDARATWFDRSGRVLGTIGPEGAENTGRISADGSKAVLSVTDPHLGTDDLWVCDIQRNTAVRITQERSSEGVASWSPDGRAILFNSDQGGGTISTVAAMGGELTRVSSREGFSFAWDWSNHGLIAGGGKGGLALIEPRPGGKRESWMSSSFGCLWVRVSPDEKWVAYASTASGSSAIYVAPAGNMAASIEVSAGTGGSWPAWRRDSQELYYATTNHEVYATRMTSAGPLDFEKPRLLFRVAGGEWDGFDAMPDGEKFLITRVLSGPPTRPINVVANWKQILDVR